MVLVCKLVENDDELAEAHAIRKEVFVVGQNVPPEIEWDEYEESALHLICKLDGETVGTGRISFFNDKAKVERVAVLEPYRNRGVGAAIVKFQIDEAIKRGAKVIYAHVQIHAKDFYSKLGFSELGEIFMEADIEHIKMVYD